MYDFPSPASIGTQLPDNIDELSPANRSNKGISSSASEIMPRGKLFFIKSSVVSWTLSKALLILSSDNPESFNFLILSLISLLIFQMVYYPYNIS